MPALLTRMSTRENCLRMLAARALTETGSRTSHALARTRIPCGISSLPAFRTGSSLRPVRTRSHPWPASACAMAKPIPRLAPVMSAVRPASAESWERAFVDLGKRVVSASSSHRKTGNYIDVVGRADAKFAATLSLSPVGALANEGQEFAARFVFLAEATQHGRRHSRGVLLLDTAHHHAEVARLNDHADTLGLDDFLDSLCDLGGEALLDLQATREEFDQAWNFAEADDFAVRNVSHVHLSEERQHVVLAEAEHLDVFHDHHFVIRDGEERALQERFGVFVIAPGEEVESFVNPLGCAKETFAHGILAQTHEHFADEVFKGGGGEGRCLGCCFMFAFRVGGGAAPA